MSRQPARTTHQTPSHDDRFRELATRYAGFAAAENVRVRAFQDESLPLFSKLPEERKAHALEFLSLANEVFGEMKQEGLTLRDDQQLLWRTLRRLRLVPEPDIFDKLENRSIEIYALDHRHLFWNLTFLELFSLTLEQLLSLPWWELASRPAEVTSAVLEIVGRIISGETPGTVAIRIPVHVIEEINSELLLRIQADVKFISPLKRDGQVVGGITVSEARVIGSAREKKKER